VISHPFNLASTYSAEITVSLYTLNSTVISTCRLHNEELNDLYGSPNNARVLKSRRMRWAGHVGEERGVYRVLVGKPEGKRPVGRPRHRWVDNIRMDL